MMIEPAALNACIRHPGLDRACVSWIWTMYLDQIHPRRLNHEGRVQHDGDKTRIEA
jgi:hypothetical protein